MSFEVHITKIATGETRVLKRPEAWDPEHSDYMWSEGNYSCDCNRSIFFEEAGNVAYDDVDEAPCGDTASTASRL